MPVFMTREEPERSRLLRSAIRRKIDRGKRERGWQVALSERFGVSHDEVRRLVRRELAARR